MSEDGQLLHQYREQGSEAAFARLAARHLNFVYATCLRETDNAALAEEAAQVVFLLLARKAPPLRPGQSLAGWLFQTARFAARNARRREERRKAWEERAVEQMPSAERESDALWDRLSPTVNDALAALGAKDREAVLLRFADGLSFPELGAALDTSEDAARMRLNRAVDRLRRFFAKQGVTLSAAVLIGLLADRTTQAAPAACADAVAKIAGVGGAAAINLNVHSQLQGALKAMTLSKLKLAATIVMGVTLAGSLPFVTRVHSHVKNNQKNQAVKRLEQAGLLGTLPNLELKDGFTLRYTVTEKDALTPAQKAAGDQETFDAEQRLVQQGSMKQADADRERQSQEAAEKLPTPPRQYFVTLSARDGKLLYISQQTGAHSYGLSLDYQPMVAPYERKVVLYDGQKTYAIVSHEGSPNALPNLDIRPGFRPDSIYDCLLPGVGLPSRPLAKSSAPRGAKGMMPLAVLPKKQPGGVGLPCDVFSFSGNRYWPGVIYLQGKGSNTKLTRMIVGRLDRPMEVWRFQEPQAFQGGWISRLSRHARFRFPPLSGSVSPIPEKTEDYEVTGTQETPLAAAQFDIHSYLSRAMMVEEYLAGENGIQSHGFLYDPRRGDLEAQGRVATSR